MPTGVLSKVLSWKSGVANRKSTVDCRLRTKDCVPEYKPVYNLCIFTE